MKRFLFTTLFSDDLGLLTRTLPIARELAKRGHAVAFCNPAHAPSQVIKEEGFANLLPRHPIFYLEMSGKPDIRGLFRVMRSGQVKRDFGSLYRFLSEYIRAIPIKFPAKTPEVWNMDHFAALCGMMNPGLVRCVCKSLMQLMTEYQADVVVDSWNLLALPVARVLRKPVVTIIQGDLHPKGRGFIWWKQPTNKIPTPVSTLNRVFAELGFHPISRTEELTVGDLTLVVGIPETDPLPEDAHVTYIGPILWQKEDLKLPGWWGELSGERPLIWLYCGNPSYGPIASWADSGLVLDVCVEALAKEDVQVILTTGHHHLPKRFSSLPANFRYAPFVPGLAMAEKSNLLIHHGGYGSCQVGLFTGTPALIIPTYSERESNARRVSALGAGDFVVPERGHRRKKRDLLVEDVRSKVRRILSEPSFTDNARRIANRMRTYGGASYGADLMEKFIEPHGAQLGG
jgi:UDP:flavonoid glycosyltransferase YjiC (YdhE family)